MGLTNCQSNSRSNEKKNTTDTSLIVRKDTNKAAKNLKKKETDSVVQIISSPIKYDSSKKYVYLTFDDGPQNGTENCFEVCKKMNIKASFFMVGAHASSASPSIKNWVYTVRNAYPQSLLCNHSQTHANGRYRYFYQHPFMAKEDFFTAQKTLQVPFKIIRLPGNSAWVLNNEIKSSTLVRATCNLLDSSGYNVIGWDTEWNFDHKTANPIQSADKMASEVINVLEGKHTHKKNHVVILTHDRMFRNEAFADSLTKMISILKNNTNYIFETVDHYPSLKSF